jgi:mannose-6-phosphate isomerase-like protein (cupin superfamily)
MIRTGDAITNPMTGERLVFHRTSSDTDGEYVLIEAIVQPDGFVAACHVHPFQSERFEVLSGELGLRVGRRTLVAGPGDTVTVQPGTPHRFWNAASGEARFMCEVRPALRFEQLLTTMFGLAEDGKTNKKGMPNPLRLAVIAEAHFDVVRLPFPPAALQRIGLAAGAAIGRTLGYEASYARHADTPAIAQPAGPGSLRTGPAYADDPRGTWSLMA